MNMISVEIRQCAESTIEDCTDKAEGTTRALPFPALCMAPIGCDPVSIAGLPESGVLGIGQR